MAKVATELLNYALIIALRNHSAKARTVSGICHPDRNRASVDLLPRRIILRRRFVNRARRPDFNPPDIFVTLFSAQRDRRHAAMCAGLMGLWGS
jgi:hypothetical protein